MSRYNASPCGISVPSGGKATFVSGAGIGSGDPRGVPTGGKSARASSGSGSGDRGGVASVGASAAVEGRAGTEDAGAVAEDVTEVAGADASLDEFDASELQPVSARTESTPTHIIRIMSKVCTR